MFIIFLLQYVNDLLILRKSKIEINKLNDLLSKEFFMEDFGIAGRYLGWRFVRTREPHFLLISWLLY